jgi:hypothetical protein
MDATAAYTHPISSPSVQVRGSRTIRPARDLSIEPRRCSIAIDLRAMLHIDHANGAAHRCDRELTYARAVGFPVSNKSHSRIHRIIH